MKYSCSFAAATGLLLAATQAGAVTITFEDLAVGTTLSTQYAALGVTFSSSPLTGASGSSSTAGEWASNTDMTIVSSSGTDIGGLGTPSLVSGNVLHSYDSWLGEDGDPDFLMQFSRAATSVSVDFAGVATPADTRLFVYNGNTLLTTIAGTVTTGQFTLGYSAPSITSVVVANGSYNDWVAVDNVTFTLTPVPEPATWATMGSGFGAVLLALRKRRRAPQAA